MLAILILKFGLLLIIKTIILIGVLEIGQKLNSCHHIFDIGVIVKNETNKESLAHFFNQFQIDIIGGLIPGTIFVFCSCIISLTMFLGLYIRTEKNPENVYITFSSILKIIQAPVNLRFYGSSSVIIFIMFCLVVGIIIYGLGQLFYRRSIDVVNKESIVECKRTILMKKILKEVYNNDDEEKHLFFWVSFRIKFYLFIEKHIPIIFDIRNQKSINTLVYKYIKQKIWKNSNYCEKIESENIKEIEELLKKELAIACPVNMDKKKQFLKCRPECIGDCDYPYSHLKDYLEARGQHLLVKYVKWNNKLERTKIHVDGYKNILGHKESYCVPGFKRSEAHIRMSNGIWHACTTLKNLSMINIIAILFLTIPLKEILSTGALHLFRNTVFLVFPNFIILLATIYSKSKINLFFHTQRLRELVFIFQSMEINSIHNNESGSIKDLELYHKVSRKWERVFPSEKENFLYIVKYITSKQGTIKSINPEKKINMICSDISKGGCQLNIKNCQDIPREVVDIQLEKISNDNNNDLMNNVFIEKAKVVWKTKKTINKEWNIGLEFLKPIKIMRPQNDIITKTALLPVLRY